MRWQRFKYLDLRTVTLLIFSRSIFINFVWLPAQDDQVSRPQWTTNHVNCRTTRAPRSMTAKVENQRRRTKHPTIITTKWMISQVLNLRIKRKSDQDMILKGKRRRRKVWEAPPHHHPHCPPPPPPPQTHPPDRRSGRARHRLCAKLNETCTFI